MGLFDFFKKKKHIEQEKKAKANVSVAFEKPKAVHEYNYPWDDRRPSSNTDFSNVNFLRVFEKPKPISNDPDIFGRAVSYIMNIYDPIKRRDELIKKGYLRYAAPAEILSTYKNTQLKDILKANDLSSTGKKVDLISRIVFSIDLESLSIPPMCCLSEKGIEYINQNQDLVMLFGNNYGITYEEYMEAKKKAPAYLSYNDIIWSVFNQRELTSHNDYSKRSWNASCRARFLFAENKPCAALGEFVTLLYFELNNPNRVIPDSFKEYYDEEELKPKQLPPDLIESIFALKEHYSKEMTDKCYKRIDVPKILIRRKDFDRLLEDIFAGKEINVKNYLPKGLR